MNRGIAVCRNGTEATRARRNPHRYPTSIPMLPEIWRGTQKIASDECNQPGSDCHFHGFSSQSLAIVTMMTKRRWQPRW